MTGTGAYHTLGNIIKREITDTYKSDNNLLSHLAALVHYDMPQYQAYTQGPNVLATRVIISIKHQSMTRDTDESAQCQLPAVRTACPRPTHEPRDCRVSSTDLRGLFLSFSPFTNSST